MTRTFLLPFAILGTMGLSAQTFTLTSKDVGGQATDQQVFDGFGCKGKNQSPQLGWTNAPEGTKSFAITMYDPDAPTGSGWWHWVAYDIPADVRSLANGAGSAERSAMPKGAKQAVTDFGAKGYGGPCPPPGHGPHQYIVTVYALKTDVLEVGENPSPALVGFNLNANMLAKASLVFYYGR